MRLAPGGLALALGLAVLPVRRAEAEPAKSAESATPSDLQSPDQRDTRNSAYTLPGNTWGFDVGALGLGGGEVYARLGAAYGLGSGFELAMNLAHTSVGLLNLSGRWHFIDTRYFDLGALLGFWYGHGKWIWIITGPAKEVVKKIDVIHVPIALTASMPLEKWLQFDLELHYSHVEVFGTVTDSESLLFDAQIGVRSFFAQPGARFFLSDHIELDLSSKLPAYTAVPVETDLQTSSEGGRSDHFEKVPFSKTWSFEAGLRSRFAPDVFGTVRLHYGQVARGLYGAPFFPSFEVEFRL